jgi:hypothetical protein
MAVRAKADQTVHAAAFGAAALIAHQVAAKATRDALFLSHFDITGLPMMVLIASLLSIITGVIAARVMSRIAPGYLIPRAFLASAILLVLEWWLSYWSHSVAAVLIYLQIAALGSVLISGFWSMLGDGFDPHSARKQFTRIVGAGTFGGLIGGLIAERVGTTFGVTSMLPVLAALHLICAFLTFSLAAVYDRPRAARPVKTRTGERSYSGFRTLKESSYVRNLGLMILLTTIGAELLDYVFKARAVAMYDRSGELVRFFALFYTAIGLLTFIVQITSSRISLEKLGLAGTVSSLPFTVALGSFGGFFVPGLFSMAFARGSEAVLRSSLFRSGYELLYAAVPRKDRRATKPILDTGFERVGDALGAALISLVLMAGAANAIPLMLALAAATGIGGVAISRRLHNGYVQSLEKSLLNQSIHIDISDIRNSTTRTVMQTLGNIGIMPSKPKPITPPQALSKPSVQVTAASDPFLKRFMDLRSSDPVVARHALEQGALDATLAPHAITLLAWDAVADDAVKALQKAAPSITGQLIDALLDPNQEFAIRRRIPRVLAASASKRSFDGLSQALFDKRFEVRFQAGRALAQMQDRSPDIEVSSELIIEAVLQELSVDRDVWYSRHIIDPSSEQDTSSVSLEHVFRLLSLFLPREPLKVAYRGLHSGDDHLTGTALEYLETVLPLRIREPIRPLLQRIEPARLASVAVRR